MPPKKSRKSAGGTATPIKIPVPQHPEPGPDAMDIDTPQETETPVNRKPSPPSATDDVVNDPWTDDETASLYKAIIRWKPNGVHGHFRMIAISEHLRNHGINPAVRTHTRIPGIWKKLESLFDMKAIDDRENNFAFGDENDDPAVFAQKYNEFSPPEEDPWFYEQMWKRRLHCEDSASESEPEIELTEPPKSLKRRWDETLELLTAPASNTAKTRASAVEDTEADASMPSSPVTRSARGARSSKRAAAKAKASSTEPEPESKADDNDGDEADEDNSDAEDAEAAASSTTKKTRASARTSTRGRGRGRKSRGG